MCRVIVNREYLFGTTAIKRGLATASIALVLTGVYLFAYNSKFWNEFGKLSLLSPGFQLFDCRRNSRKMFSSAVLFCLAGNSLDYNRSRLLKNNDRTSSVKAKCEDSMSWTKKEGKDRCSLFAWILWHRRHRRRWERRLILCDERDLLYHLITHKLWNIIHCLSTAWLKHILLYLNEADDCRRSLKAECQ